MCGVTRSALELAGLSLASIDAVAVTVEPGLYYPEWGGIRLEDLVWLAPSGEARCLTELEDFLEL